MQVDDICTMNIKPPIRDLIRLSISFSTAITLFFFIMNYIQDLDLLSSLYIALFGGLLLMTASGLNIGLIVLFNIVDPTASMKRARVRHIVGILLMTAIYALFRSTAGKYNIIPEHINHLERTAELAPWQYFLINFIPALMLFILVNLIHNIIILFHLKAATEREMSVLRSANAEASNQLLRQQVQPHFLFNALSVLKSLINTDTKVAETYLLRLSDFLRTSFSQKKKDTASVKEEIKLCMDYLEMQKIRFGEALEFTVDIPESYLEHPLPFFSLQILAENAIKHNILTEESPLYINIYITDDVLVVENNLQKKPFVEDSNGQGLANLSERYHLLSGNRLEIKKGKRIFSVGFKMN